MTISKLEIEDLVLLAFADDDRVIWDRLIGGRLLIPFPFLSAIPSLLLELLPLHSLLPSALPGRSGLTRVLSTPKTRQSRVYVNATRVFPRCELM